MGTEIELSVIIPVYNTKEYLDECINSVLNQKSEKIEIILVDDGSTDGSEEICDVYADKNLNMKVIHQSNAGPSVARNSGLEVAKGKFVTFLDSDDYVCDDIYLNILSMFDSIEKERGVRVDIIGMGRKLLFPDGHTKTLYCHEKYRFLSGRDYLDAVLSYDGVDMSACDKVFRKDVFDGVSFPPGMIGEDGLILPQIACKVNSVVLSGVCGYVYRQREGSRSKKYSINYLKSYKAYQKNAEIIETSYPDLMLRYRIFVETFLCETYLLYQSTKNVDAKDGVFLKKEFSLHYKNMMKDFSSKKLKMKVVFLRIGCGRVYTDLKNFIRYIFEV